MDLDHPALEELLTRTQLNVHVIELALHGDDGDWLLRVGEYELPPTIEIGGDNVQFSAQTGPDGTPSAERLMFHHGVLVKARTMENLPDIGEDDIFDWAWTIRLGSTPDQDVSR